MALSLLLTLLYLWVNVLWKKKLIYIYISLLLVIAWREPSFVFVVLNFMTVVFLILTLVHKVEKNFYLKILGLNIFFLSVSFIVFKFYLLSECIALTNFLYFTLNDTSQIAVEVGLSNAYQPYPEQELRFFLSKRGFEEQFKFLTSDFYHLPGHLLLYFYWLCFCTDFVPFIDITLVVK